MADFNITFVPYAPGSTDSQGQRISSIDPRLSRTNYFDGRLLKASDLTRDQVYLDERALEIGQILGSGIVNGLDVSLVDNYRLRVGPGMAIAPSGRVLQLAERTLEVNLGNAALIASLNHGYYRRFKRGLYLVALQYAEVGSDSAEAYPADLASPRRFNFNSFAEGVELVLVPLAIPLSQTSEIAARAGLVAEFIGAGRSGQRPELSDEAVALGLLALEQGRPLWLDKGLAHRPLRQPGAPDAPQQDLIAHYDELLETVLATRNASGLSGGFPASKYFRLLPPRGRLPKAVVDPVNGAQTYFPAGYEVSIAPVRRDDLASILRESEHLAPMDLEKDADADIMVLVPLSNSEFAWRARGLERGATTPKDAFGLGRLLAIDRLALRVRPLPKPHAIDTDAEVWKGIWEAAREEEILFVRRPPRTAETNVSAVVLARGFDLPKPSVDLSAYNRVMEKELAATQLQLKEATLDLSIGREDFARRLRNLKLDPDAPAKELADQLKALETERDKLAARVKELEDAGGGGNADLDKAKAQIEKLTAQLEAAKKQIADLQAAGSSAASTELAAVLEKNQALSRELENANKTITELKAALDNNDSAALAEAKAAVEKLGKELEVANKRITELQASAGGGASASELEAAKLRIEKLTGELEAANKRITELQAAGTGSSNADLDAAKASIDKLGKELEVANKRITELQSAGGGAGAAELDAAKARIDKLTQELDSANKRITELQAAGTGTSGADLDAAKAKIDTLTKELAAGNKRITELQAASDSAIAELEAGKSAAAKLFEELAAANKRIADLQAGATQPAATSVQDLAKLRPASDATSRKALDKLNTTLANRPEEAAVVADILMLMDRRYDAVIWPTLASVADQPGQLAKLRDFLQKNTDADRPVGAALAASGADFGLSAALVTKWKELG